MTPSTKAPASSPIVERSTIEQVATAAGVSVATVSRALRGLPNVAASTRTKVERAARELNYRANPAAARLATGRSHTIAIVVPLINSWYFSNVVAGAEAVCTEEGYDLLVLTAPNAELRHEVVATAAELERHTDGMIFVEVALPPRELEQLGRRRLAVATIGQQTDTFPSVHVDNVRVGSLAAQHLLDLGHRRIGVIGAQAEEPSFFDVPGQRIAGAGLAMGRIGGDLEPALVVDGQFTIEGGYDAASRLLSGENPPSAIFALSDEMAFGALRGTRHGPRRPRRRVGRRRRRPRALVGRRSDDGAPTRRRTRRRGRPGARATAARATHGTRAPRLDSRARRALDDRSAHAVSAIRRPSFLTQGHQV
ncbi:MAG: LacI family DNA-binding transcriptional regulator [Ilumatobacteraceae bacterium]